MASRGQSLTIAYVAWDTMANGGKTGDAENHTLRWVRDGVSAAPASAPVEIDAVNAPGLYRLALSAEECTCDAGVLSGRSSTSGVAILPLTITFEQLPLAAPGSAGGLATVDANNRVAGVQSTVTLAPSERQALANQVLKQSVAEVQAEAAEHSLSTIVLAMLESSTAGTTWTIHRTDGTTIHATRTVVRDPSAAPITAVS